MLEKLVCPQCGGNDLQPFGGNAFKCQACGTILKDEPEEKPVEQASHYVAPTQEFLTSEQRYNDNDGGEIFGGDDDDDTAMTKKIFGGVIGIIAVVVLIFLVSCPSQNKPAPPDNYNYQIPTNSGIDSMTNALNAMINGVDSISKLNNSGLDPEAAPTYQENGITVNDVVQTYNGVKFEKGTLLNGSKMKISLKKPSGFTHEGKKVFVGIEFSIKDHNGNIIYNEDDLNKLKDDGEDFSHYAKSCDITFSISSEFGFSGTGNYFLQYRVWDKKSDHEISGTIPLHVEDVGQ